jgi:hypothetical protein
MSILLLLIGILAALAILAAAVKVPGMILKALCALGALLVLFVFFALASIRYIGASEVGIVVKNAFGGRLKDGRIIATNGEMGTQAGVLRSGWHFWYWPVLYEIKTVPFIEIKSDEVGLIETTDGLPMGAGQLFAPEWPQATRQQMLDGTHFLTVGAGMKGKQVSVLTPGKYPLNTDLFHIKMVKQTEVVAGEVAVLKTNFGAAPSLIVRHIAAGAADRPAGEDDALKLAKPGEMGILADALPPGKYPLNTDAFTVTEIWTTQMIAHYTAILSGTPSSQRDFQSAAQQRAATQTKQGKHDSSMEEREITVRTVDGFTFPVDVRLEYVIEPKDAPILVAKLGDDEGERFRNAINSAVRAIFRNNAEKVRALDYVQQRSTQEEQSLATLKTQMARFGITVAAVRIGNVGDEASLGKLLDTQTQREIAKQEQITTQEQQKAAEQKKQLAKTTQESDEEKKLATATYAVKIADEEKKKVVIAAGAEAESIKIKAVAQADAYKAIAAQIGSANAALIEVLKIVGERNITITPRVMVNNRAGGGGSAAAGQSAETTALIGTMLDQMIAKDEPRPNDTKLAPK